MTGRTHDLAAFTSLVAIVSYQPVPQMSLATVVVALGANMLGGVAPDLDQPTAKLWYQLPAGSLVGRIIHPLLGGHRLISHSLLGWWLTGLLVKWLLAKIGTVLLVDMSLVWWSFMIGYASHLITDTITREGVPWFFPIPIRFGIPPFKSMRMATGGFLEKAIIFPGLMVTCGYIIYQHYDKILKLFRIVIMRG